MPQETTRKSLSKKIRFEVFKRDAFTCQYCGRKAPDVVLQIDHIEPVSKGGTNEFLNLVTSCVACNSGKSDRRLSDNSVLEKQRQQLQDLQERKEQIEMLFEWKKGLMDLDDQVTQELSDVWSAAAPGFSLNQSGLNGLRKLTKQFSVDEIITAMHISAEQYLRFVDDSPTQESVENAWKKVGGICNNRKRDASNPDLKRLRYIRGILRNRLNYIVEDEALKLLEQTYALGASVENREKHALAADRWTDWRDEVQEFVWKQKAEGPVLKANE